MTRANERRFPTGRSMQAADGRGCDTDRLFTNRRRNNQISRRVDKQAERDGLRRYRNGGELDDDFNYDYDGTIINYDCDNDYLDD